MPAQRPGLVSVVIADPGDAIQLRTSLTALAAMDWPNEQLETIVVLSADASEDVTRAAADEELAVEVVRSTADLRRLGGANIGAARARGEFVAFLGRGARPGTHWVREAMRSFRASAQVGAVASRVISRGDGDAGFTGGQLTWYGMGYNTPDASSPLPDDHPHDLLFGTSSALFVRASVFSDVGGFDERLFRFYDDVDLGWRINLFGHRVRYVPSSVVHALRDDPEPGGDVLQERYLLERNALILLYKNLDEDNLGRFLAGALGLAARRAVTASGLDSAEYGLDRNGTTAPADSGTEVRREALAGLFGIDQFVEILGEIEPERTRIQRRRRVRDDALFPLFGDSGNALHLSTSVQEGLRDIARALSITTPAGRVRVLVITGDLVGPRMAGPAIRAWSMCEQLAARNDVRLVSPIRPTRAAAAFDVMHAPDDKAMREHEEWADVVVIQGYILHQFRSLARTEKILVADIYDPLHLEQLEQARDTRFEEWNTHVILASEVLNEQIARADFLLCASEKQRDFWLGQLAAVGRVNAMTYESDNALRDLLAVAPFGLNPDIPEQERHAIKGVVPGIGPDDKVLIWGGGIYDWFDTETLLRAMAKVVVEHPDAKLFFLGVAHPNPGVPIMKAQARTFELADALGLTDTHVFFNREWVAYDDRHNYLLDADAGVSTHFEHIETAFSFRTRILDYLWARLPMVTTRGDGFADLIDDTPLGVTVPERDVEALADAIVRVLYDDELRSGIGERMESVRERFAWSHALEPLTSFCAAPHPASDRVRADHAHVLRMPDPTADAIRGRYRGFGKYARLSSLYLRRDGFGGLIERARFRLGL